MNITINLAVLLDVVLILLLGGSVTYLAMLQHKKRKALRSLAAQWRSFPVPLRAHMRTQTFFEQPLAKHQELYPKDLQVVISFIDAGEACSALCFHHSGLSDVASWSEGNGLDIVKTMVKAVSEMEHFRAGLIPVLQVMLDEQRDKANATVK